MATYGDNLRASLTTTVRAARPEGKISLRPADRCREGGVHGWDVDADHDQSRLRSEHSGLDLRVQLGTCVRCGDGLLSITSYDDDDWVQHQQLISVRDLRIPADQQIAEA